MNNDPAPIMTHHASGAKIIHGKNVAAALRRKMRGEIERLSRDYQLKPGLAVVMVGDNPASDIYVRNKHKASLEVGMNSFEKRLPASVTQEELLDEVRALNNDSSVHGILVQLPLPEHIDPKAVIDTIDPIKDVDGFHVTNVGRLSVGLPALIPCTPKGCLHLLKLVEPKLSGLNAVIIGRSNIVGKPMAQLLLAENCTVIITHSRTRDLPDICRRADIVVAAIGQPEFVQGDWLSENAIVMDVGINRIAAPDTATGSRIVGDVNFKSAVEKVRAITPVPGGIGPMTIACLLDNTLKAACLQTGTPRPVIQV